ncbi:sialate O-acetylesterase [Cohnella soli]|uniref:Sialate O-acetylesterase n=1 Tax=Cohnella soli TaxID=425005 RepID=A0ABW0HTG8_9BACL
MKEIDLFVMSGQSNMQGESESPVDLSIPWEMACEYKYVGDSLVQLRHPVGEDITDDRGSLLLAAAHLGNGSLVPSFAEHYYRQSGRRACYVHAAKGATSAAEWQKGTPRFACLVNKVKGAVQRLEQDGFAVKRKNFVWLQGESDGINGTGRDAYAALLKQFRQDMEAELGLETFMMIRIAKFHSFPCIPIMEAQERLTRGSDKFVMLTRITGTFTIENGLMQGSSAPFHYTNAGYEKVGEIAGRNAAKHLDGVVFELEEECYPELESDTKI